MNARGVFLLGFPNDAAKPMFKGVNNYDECCWQIKYDKNRKVSQCIQHHAQKWFLLSDGSRSQTELEWQENKYEAVEKPRTVPLARKGNRKAV